MAYCSITYCDKWLWVKLGSTVLINARSDDGDNEGVVELMGYASKVTTADARGTIYNGKHGGNEC